MDKIHEVLSTTKQWNYQKLRKHEVQYSYIQATGYEIMGPNMNNMRNVGLVKILETSWELIPRVGTDICDRYARTLQTDTARKLKVVQITLHTVDKFYLMSHCDFMILGSTESYQKSLICKEAVQ